MAEDYGGRFGQLRKTFEEQEKAKGIKPATTAAERDKKRYENALNTLRKELLTYQAKAEETARSRTLKELREKLANGLFEGEHKEEAERMVDNPSLIEAQPIDEDYGESRKRVAVLLGLIKDPAKEDEAEQEADKLDFIKNMKGFSDRHVNK